MDHIIARWELQLSQLALSPEGAANPPYRTHSITEAYRWRQRFAHLEPENEYHEDDLRLINATREARDLSPIDASGRPLERTSKVVPMPTRDVAPTEDPPASETDESSAAEEKELPSGIDERATRGPATKVLAEAKKLLGHISVGDKKGLLHGDEDVVDDINQRIREAKAKKRATRKEGVAG